MALPIPREDLVDDDDARLSTIAELRAEAEELGYPNTTHYLYANGLLEEFMLYTLGRSPRPNCAEDDGIRTGVTFVLRRANILRGLREQSLVTDKDIEEYFFPSDGSQPMDDELWEKYVPKSGDQPKIHGAYELP